MNLHSNNNLGGYGDNSQTNKAFIETNQHSRECKAAVDEMRMQL